MCIAVICSFVQVHVLNSHNLQEFKIFPIKEDTEKPFSPAFSQQNNVFVVINELITSFLQHI